MTPDAANAAPTKAPARILGSRIRRIMLVFCWEIIDESIMLSKIGNCSPSIDKISVKEI